MSEHYTLSSHNQISLRSRMEEVAATNLSTREREEAIFSTRRLIIAQMERQIQEHLKITTEINMRRQAEMKLLTDGLASQQVLLKVELNRLAHTGKDRDSSLTFTPPALLRGNPLDRAKLVFQFTRCVSDENRSDSDAGSACALEMSSCTRNTPLPPASATGNTTNVPTDTRHKRRSVFWFRRMGR
jgi:hypothetical protein